jgi:hypothetical protein
MVIMAEDTVEQVKPLRVKAEELDQHVGQYTTLWREKRRQVAHIESLDKEAKKILYLLMSGADKGDRIKSRYDDSQEIFVYNERQLVLALLET